jgi:hypothetical protein
MLASLSNVSLVNNTSFAMESHQNTFALKQQQIQSFIEKDKEKINEHKKTITELKINIKDLENQRNNETERQKNALEGNYLISFKELEETLSPREKIIVEDLKNKHPKQLHLLNDTVKSASPEALKEIQQIVLKHFQKNIDSFNIAIQQKISEIKEEEFKIKKLIYSINAFEKLKETSMQKRAIITDKNNNKKEREKLLEEKSKELSKAIQEKKAIIHVAIPNLDDTNRQKANTKKQENVNQLNELEKKLNTVNEQIKKLKEVKKTDMGCTSDYCNIF